MKKNQHLNDRQSSIASLKVA